MGDFIGVTMTAVVYWALVCQIITKQYTYSSSLCVCSIAS